MRALTTVFLLLLLAACAPTARDRALLPAGLTEIEVRPPEFRVLPEQTEIEFFNPPGMGGTLLVSIGVRIVNTNEVVLGLRDSSYTVYAWGEEVGRGELETSAILAPGSSELETLRVSIDVERMTRLLPQAALALRGAPLPLRFEGRLNGRALGRSVSFGPLAFLHFNVTDAKQVQPPRMTVVPVATRLFLPEANVPVARVVLEVQNAGEVGYYLFGQSLLLLLDEKPLALADLSPVAIPAKSSRRVDVVFYPNLDTLSPETRTLLAGALSGVPMAFGIEGQFRLDVLGVDTYQVPPGWRIEGFISGRD